MKRDWLPWQIWGATSVTLSTSPKNGWLAGVAERLSFSYAALDAFIRTTGSAALVVHLEVLVLFACFNWTMALIIGHHLKPC